MPKAKVDQANIDDELRQVQLPSGAKWNIHQREVMYFNERTRKYLDDNHFVNVSDLQDLDRVLILELLIFRWATWISQQRDYWGDGVDENSLQRAMKDHSAELRQLKKSLGIDKESRDKQRGEDSVSEYLSQLRLRAQEFGYTRNKQLDKALELFNQLKALMILHDNCDDQERIQQHVTESELFDWIREVAITEYDSIDEHFRSNSQRYWISTI